MRAMRSTEGHEHGEQTAGKHGRPRLKKKRLAIAAVVSVALLLLLVIVWMRRDSDVNSALSSAGLARLPDSAKDVMMSTQGGVLDDVRVTFIRFTTPQDDILAFLQGSGIHTPGKPTGGGWGGEVGFRKTRWRSLLRRVLRSRPRSIRYPSWWKEAWQSPGMLQYCPAPDYKDRSVIVDCATNTVYIQLWHTTGPVL